MALSRRELKVLLVDDDERFLKATSAVLKRRDFDVHVSNNGPGALAIAQVKQIDVAVLDIKMEELDGNQTMRQLKNARPEMEVIMLTGYGDPRSAFRALNDGAFDYLTKPCEVDVLEDRILDAYEHRHHVADYEKRVADVMVPITSFSVIGHDRTVAEAIEVVVSSFRLGKPDKLHDHLHRSILVKDDGGEVVGVVTFVDLIRGLLPPYMRSHGSPPENARDAVKTESYRGMFTIMARALGKQPIIKYMRSPPPSIDHQADLVEAVNRMIFLQTRRLLVKNGERVAGVLREQDIFFEMYRINQEWNWFQSSR